MITIDGKELNVEVTDLGLDVEFVYKFAERTESYEMQYELGAVYYNQSITFGTSCTDNPDFQELFRILSTKSSIDEGTGHDVVIMTPLGKLNFLMYPNKLSLKMLHYEQSSGNSWWTGLNVKFIALKPVESW